MALFDFEPFDDSDRGDRDTPVCITCGNDMEWIACDACGGEGGWLLDDDPEDDYYGDEWELCDLCEGNGGEYVCLSTHAHTRLACEAGGEKEQS